MSRTASAAGEVDRRSGQRLELLAVVLLSMTTILTAWTAFQASKWGGQMSISFGEASTQRIEAARLDGTANQRAAVQVSLWTEWVTADGAGDTELAAFLVDRFPEPLATAHADWLAAGGADGTVASPFAVPSFALPERAAAEDADARADALFARGLDSNRTADDYTLLTVLFASVLFFSAMSGRVDARRSRQALLVLAVLPAVVGTGLLVSFPKLL